MTDTIEDMKALKDHQKAERADNWTNRDAAWLDPLKAAGWDARVISEVGRHCRVMVRGGWFDFWPSTGKWMRSPRKGGQRGPHGMGLQGLIEALEAQHD